MKVAFLLNKIAQKHDKDISMLVDDAGDEGLRTLEMLAVKTLETGRIGLLLRKGMRPGLDSYSAFFENDHRTDTVVKKELYETIRVPRLWMVDPRYDNVEIYHSTEWGLKLQGILAGSEVLTENLIPEFQFVIAALFADQPTEP